MKHDLASSNENEEKKSERKGEDDKMHQKVNHRVKNENDITKTASRPDTNLKFDLKYDENDLQSLILYARQKMTGNSFFYWVPMHW